MTHFQSILQALFTMPSSQSSDVSDTITLDDDYRDDTSISTASSPHPNADGIRNHHNELHKPEYEASRSQAFTSTQARLISVKSMGKSLPIACPTPSRDHIREKEFEQDLKFMYNESTWRMYNRIVDARTKKQVVKKTSALLQMDQDYKDSSKRRLSSSSGKIKRSSNIRTDDTIPGIIYATSLPIISSQFQGMIESSPHEIPDEIHIFHMDE